MSFKPRYNGALGFREIFYQFLGEYDIIYLK